MSQTLHTARELPRIKSKLWTSLLFACLPPMPISNPYAILINSIENISDVLSLTLAGMLLNPQGMVASVASLLSCLPSMLSYIYPSIPISYILNFEIKPNPSLTQALPSFPICFRVNSKLTYPSLPNQPHFLLQIWGIFSFILQRRLCSTTRLATSWSWESRSQPLISRRVSGTQFI